MTSGTRFLVPLALLVLALPLASAAHHVHEPCSDAASPEAFATGSDDFENLHFQGGLLYATGSDGKLHAFEADGGDTVVADLGGRSGAMVTGLDGGLYVRVRSDQVWRFAPDGSHTVVAEGLVGANGLAIDAAGNLYVSDEPNGRIYRLPAGDYANWTEWAFVDGANGLVVDDARGVLYVAMTTDGRSTIAAVDLDDPANVTDVAHLSFGAFSANVFWYASNHTQLPLTPYAPSDPSSPLVFKAFDDLTLGPDGRLYAAAWATGEILRVDPATGAACAVASGLDAPTSVRVARGFGDADGDLFVTDFGGHAGLVAPLPGAISRIPLGLAPADGPVVSANASATEEPARAVPLPTAFVALAAFAGLRRGRR